MDLRLAKAAEASAITESQVLQLASAAFITHRAIERMIREQEFDNALARLMNLWSIGMDYHTFRNRQSASNLQLRSLFHFDETHAASRLQRKVVVVAKRGDGNTCLFRGINHQRSRRCLQLMAVDREINRISHKFRTFCV